ncbi:MAG: 3-deoxy-D-manno-octulosonic acid transferase [Nitrospiraceae bacterium]|nr:MAG: 3-deoxy-D-manno-octulosonic acid transferase [Nitrospiraceae bacterium]
MQSLYNLISTIGVILYLPRLLVKKGPEDRRAFIKERLGLSSYRKTDIWVHAVSVGETLASIPFLKKLRKEFPDRKIVFSTTTYTGQKIARDKFPEADRILYMPLDSVFCIKRVVNSLRPEIFITVETELWPALFRGLRDAGSRILVLNGRISQGSFKGYSRIKFLMADMLSSVDFFYMQDKGDAERIIALGADKHKVGIMGNFKFDIDLKEELPLNWLTGLSGKIVLAASTHEGEEELLLEAFNIINKELPGTKLIIAPRHPERFNETAGLIEKRGLSYIRRSSLNGKGMARASDADIILLDTLGEMSRVFSRTSVAFIGGSLVPRGGHNIMEPAYWSKPVIFGPHMENFPIAGEFLKKSAGIEVSGPKDMAETVIALLRDNKKAAEMGRNARAIVDKNTGAVKKAIELIRGYIGTA